MSEIRYARHRPGGTHDCNRSCRHREMVQSYHREREIEETRHENGGPKPTLTFERWLRHYWKVNGL